MDVPEAVRAADPGSGESTMDERGEARPEGPHPDPDRDDGAEEIGEMPELEESGDGDGWSLFGWLQDTPEGSYRDMDARDYWDPENGGKNRLAFHVSDLVGTRGVPNGVGLLLALAEMYYNLAQHQDGGSSSSGDDGGGSSGDGFPEIQEASAV